MVSADTLHRTTDKPLLSFRNDSIIINTVWNTIGWNKNGVKKVGSETGEGSYLDLVQLADRTRKGPVC